MKRLLRKIWQPRLMGFAAVLRKSAETGCQLGSVSDCGSGSFAFLCNLYYMDLWLLGI